MIPPHLDFRRLRQVAITAVLAARGVRLRERRGRLVGPCPVHGGDNPRAFVVDPRRNVWYCFTRHHGGDVIELVRGLEGCDHRQAAQVLARFADQPLVAPEPHRLPSPTPARPGPSWRPYTRQLPLDPRDARILAKGIRPDTARRHEVGRYHGPGFLARCLGVRLHDSHGRPLGYTGRRLDSCEIARYGRWKLPSGFPKSRFLYNLHRVRPELETRGVVLVECPWAVLRLAQLQVPAVALLGTRLSRAQHRLLAPARRIVLLLDGDPAGRLATNELRRDLGPKAHPLLLPSGHDPDDLSDTQLHALLDPFFPS